LNRRRGNLPWPFGGKPSLPRPLRPQAGEGTEGRADAEAVALARDHEAALPKELTSSPASPWSSTSRATSAARTAATLSGGVMAAWVSARPVLPGQGKSSVLRNREERGQDAQRRIGRLIEGADGVDGFGRADWQCGPRLVAQPPVEGYNRGP